MLQNIEIAFPSIVCSACKKKTSAADFEASQGNCSCGSLNFDVTILVRKHFTYQGGDSEPGAFGTSLLMSGRLGRIAKGGGSGDVDESTEDTEYVLPNLPSPTIFDLAQTQPERVLDFISDLRKEAARANLHAGQGVCKQCKSVYTLAHGGFAAEGYCSKICKSVYEREHPAEAPAAAAPQKSAVVKCPKCAKSTKVRPGKSNVCMWCGTPV